jgi:hypothetical protein
LLHYRNRNRNLNLNLEASPVIVDHRAKWTRRSSAVANRKPERRLYSPPPGTAGSSSSFLTARACTRFPTRSLLRGGTTDPAVANDDRKRLPMNDMKAYCCADLVAPNGGGAHLVATLDLTLSRLRLLASLSRHMTVDQRLSSSTKRIRLRVATKCNRLSVLQAATPAAGRENPAGSHPPRLRGESPPGRTRPHGRRLRSDSE